VKGNNRIHALLSGTGFTDSGLGRNLADLELHTSLAKKKDVARPTMMVFDLDPGAPADIVQCCQVGLWLRDLLEKMKLKSFAKTAARKVSKFTRR
jgi:bifunctional non-homologous end joining protein LigD